MLCAYAMASGSVRAARHLFARFYIAVLRAPVLFFDSTPCGRILNRFAEDVSCIDRVMPFTVRSMINCVLAGFASIFVVAFATPWFLVSLPALIFIYYYIQVKCGSSHCMYMLKCYWLWLCIPINSFGNHRAFSCLSFCLFACSMPCAYDILSILSLFIIFLLY